MSENSAGSSAVLYAATFPTVAYMAPDPWPTYPPDVPPATKELFITTTGAELTLQPPLTEARMRQIIREELDRLDRLQQQRKRRKRKAKKAKKAKAGASK